MADLLALYLEQLEVPYVFGVPGGAVEPLYDALARSARRGGPRPVVARHEAGAAFMADGYARETGRLGVCCSTAGPGATNMITGVASAYEDEVPLLVLTAQTARPGFGRGASQESSCTAVNTVAMYAHCTRYSSLVSHEAQLEHKLAAALMAAHQPPQGPAHLSIPLDVLRAPAQRQAPGYDLRERLRPPLLLDRRGAARLAQALRRAAHSVFVLGPGAAPAVSSILRLASRLGAGVLTTPQGKGLVNPYHPAFRGVYGLAGHASASRMLAEPGVELVVVVGSALDELATNGWDRALLGPRLVHVDPVEAHFQRTPMAAFHVGGHVGLLFLELERRLAGHRHPGALPWAVVVPFERRRGERRRRQDAAARPAQERRSGKDRRRSPGPSPFLRRFALRDEALYLSAAAPIKPQRLMYELSRRFPQGTRFLADIGNAFLWAIHYLQPVYRPEDPAWQGSAGGYLRMGMGFASMGWAVGAAVGTALGAPGRPVVCVVGDGAFLMAGQELTTAVQERLPVIFVVLNDGALGTVKHGQRMAGAEPVAFQLPPVDFATYAEALGVPGYVVHGPEDFERFDVQALCRRRGPSLIDVRVDGEEPPPLGERLQMLAGGQGRR